MMIGLAAHVATWYQLEQFFNGQITSFTWLGNLCMLLTATGLVLLLCDLATFYYKLVVAAIGKGRKSCKEPLLFQQHVYDLLFAEAFTFSLLALPGFIVLAGIADAKDRKSEKEAED